MMVFRFVEREVASYPVIHDLPGTRCLPARVLAWSRRPPSKRAHADTVLGARIRFDHESSGGTYGVPQVHAELRYEGTRSAAQASGRPADAGRRLESDHRRRFVRTTLRDRDAAPRPTSSNGRSRPRLPTACGSPTSPTCRDTPGDLALALNTRPRKTLGWRTPAKVLDDVLRSAGQGSVATTPLNLVGTRAWLSEGAQEARIALSRGSTSDCYDNAMAESFFASPRDRAHRSLELAHPGRREARGVRLHRGLLQPASDQGTMPIGILDDERRDEPLDFGRVAAEHGQGDFDLESRARDGDLHRPIRSPRVICAPDQRSTKDPPIRRGRT
jgi:putative transposase